MIDGSPLVIETDHKPILSITKMKEPSRRQWRWITQLSEYDVSFRYVKGKENVVADLLSRVPCKVDSRESNGTVNLLTTTPAISIQNLVELQDSDEDIKVLIVDKSKHSLQIIKRNGILYDVSTGSLRLLLPRTLRSTEILRLHNLNHPGIKGTFELVSQRFVWPNMRKDVMNQVRGCQACQKNKVYKHTKSNYSQLPTCGNERFSVIHMDIVGPLPSCEGHRYLLTMIDRETNWLEAIPLRSIDTKSIMEMFQVNWISRFGVPSILITDKGTQFMSEAFNNFCDTMGIDKRKQHLISSRNQREDRKNASNIKNSFEMSFRFKWRNVEDEFTLGFVRTEKHD